MRTFILSVVLACVTFASCNTTKPNGAPPANDITMPEGSWELNYITGPRITFEGLYPNRKPTLIIDIVNKRISGNTGCNSYSGAFVSQNSAVSFSGPIAVTKMMCAESASGETTYLETLKKIDKFSITGGNTLNLFAGDIMLMRFTKR